MRLAVDERRPAAQLYLAETRAERGKRPAFLQFIT